MKIFLLTVINTDMFKIGIVLLVITVILMGFVTGLKKLFAKNKKKFFLYILVVLLLFAATALLSNERVLSNIPLNNFISFQVVFLILGVLHVLALRKFFPDLSETPTSFWSEFLYTIVTVCMGLISFVYVIGLYKAEYTYIFIAAVIAFVIPFTVVKLYEFSLSIPVPIYKKWFYPLDKKVKDPKDDELVNPLVISFEFNKGRNIEEISNFRLKAPERMEFGKLFYFFINDYNERHPGGEISYIDNGNSPSGWIFYTRPNWLGFQKFINYNKTVEGNNIKENDVIICKRV
ncbi:TssN family type VI secretion system protein [Aquimarina aquimarini]|uniref:TssN family type VI secretion system protein n=1 Tax=Aquimarina aquimarini TaxID=1191734 RepID=UPI001900D7FF|nr:TssN family type VI secretion system protein [Aquimarina aquimarini]